MTDRATQRRRGFSILTSQSWDSCGKLVYQLQLALATRVWHAASLFSPSELLHNALAGYYILLLNVKAPGGKLFREFHTFAEWVAGAFYNARCVVLCPKLSIPGRNRMAGAGSPTSYIVQIVQPLAICCTSLRTFPKRAGGRTSGLPAWTSRLFRV